MNKIKIKKTQKITKLDWTWFFIAIKFSDGVKRDFFQDVAVLGLLYGFTT